MSDCMVVMSQARFTTPHSHRICSSEPGGQKALLAVGYKLMKSLVIGQDECHKIVERSLKCVV